jgi:DNA-binding transcriptional regulator YiaG
MDKLIDLLTGVTLRTVAEWAEVSEHTVLAWRKGRRHPSPAAIQRLAIRTERHAEILRRVAVALQTGR